MGKNSKYEIRKKIIENLESQGFIINKNNEIVTSEKNTKDEIRFLHKHFKEEKTKAHQNFINQKLMTLKKYFADGKDVIPEKISPKIHLVEANTEMSDLFKLTSLYWSIPVSQGFGRKMRFVVMDQSNNKLIGIFALCDPVFNLKARDSHIVWTQEQRKERLYNVMDINVSGAVPPYSQLLCGKLVSMLSSSNYVRNLVWEKYKDNVTTISQNKKEPHLVLLTTLSALGKSSQYNRLKYKERMLFIKIGESSGWGHFHLANSTFDLMREYLEEIEHPIIKKNRFGQGPNWKIRAIRTCLELLGLPTSLLNHGIKREVYICPLAKNYIEYLQGTHVKPIYYNNETHKIINFFIKRWLIPRAGRNKDYQKFLASEIFEHFAV